MKRFHRYAIHAGAAAALAFSAACGGSSGSSLLTPTTPTPTTPAVTETYTDTIPQLGSASHVFTVASSGEVDVSVTAVSPLATMAVGVEILSSDGTSCLTALGQNDNARVGSVALSGLAANGSYCVKVYDSGNIPDGGSSDVTVQVVHY
ncbi:MAG TPA: hypothetical protein VG871_06880 [Vicinamibacterales bacterium]|nr:hypothetical protein [Vicinamibacterales bacterium]